MEQYAQETCQEGQEGQEVQEICFGIQESWLDTKKNFTDPVNLWTNLCKNINIFIKKLVQETI